MPKSKNSDQPESPDEVRSKNPQVLNSKKALALKQQAEDEAPERPVSQTEGKGMRSLPNTKDAPSGALEQEGQRPVLERSRKVR